MDDLRSLITLLLAVCTGMVGYHIHSSVGWAILNGILWPFAWVKWLICHEVTLRIVRETFDFLFK